MSILSTEWRSTLETMLSDPTSSDENLRTAIVKHAGLPKQTQTENADSNICSVRGRVWKRLLGVGKLDVERYTALVAMGHHPGYGEKILNDTFRTCASDEVFRSRTSEAQIYRLLNAFVNAHALPVASSAGGNTKINTVPTGIQREKQRDAATYVQGMNILVAPLLMVMPELDAFYAFEALVTKCIPTYVSRNVQGVKDGCDLVDECLQLLDPVLHAHLARNNHSPHVYAFASVLTLGACAPPLSQVLGLWDMYLACGVHLNVLFQAAQVMLHRDLLLAPEQSGASSSSASLLSGREFPEPDARALAAVALPALLRLPNDLLRRMRMHTTGHTEQVK